MAQISPPQQSSPSAPLLLTYNFTTVTLDARGKETERRQGQARYFVEDLGGVKLEMVFAPSGGFYMGTSGADAAEVVKEYTRYEWPGGADWVNTETPGREVEVPAFFIGKFQVTQAQWKAIARLPKINIDLALEPSNHPKLSNFKDDVMQPVEQVSWNDVQEFCARLTRKAGRLYRLPSEAEWEYACRAGTMTPFAFGETITPGVVNYNGDYPYANAPNGEFRKKPVPVGSLGVANEFGLFDMHGNVSEWCQDKWHGNYAGAPTDGSAWESGSADRRVLRGGSWSLGGYGCRAAHRAWTGPGSRVNPIGFRVVAPTTTP